MDTYHGILVYEILEGGNLLNGIYSDTILVSEKYYVDSEVARKRQTGNNSTGIEGTYDCSWIESLAGTMNQCELKITKQGYTYVFIWSKQGIAHWKGIGILSGTTHISVSYVEV